MGKPITLKQTIAELKKMIREEKSDSRCSRNQNLDAVIVKRIEALEAAVNILKQMEQH